MRSRRQSIAPLAAAGLLFLMMSGWAGASQAQHYAVQPESAFWIEGRATTGRFTCQASDVKGHGTLRAAAGEGRPAEAVVLIRVRGFDCGNRRMNADLYDALDAEEHPLIRFALTDAEALSAPADAAPAADTAQANRLRATGSLTLAGTPRRVDVLVRWRRLADGRVLGRGEKTLRMTDFGVEPPTAFLGLIKAHDRITVRFELVAAEAPAGRAGGGVDADG